MPWSLSDLREKLRPQLGASAYASLCDALQSFSAKHRIAAYHAIKARTLLDGPLATRGGDKLSSLMVALLEPTKDQISQGIAVAYVETEAHLYAYAQSLHAASDILAKVIYYAIPIEFEGITLRRVCLRVIRNRHIEQAPAFCGGH